MGLCLFSPKTLCAKYIDTVASSKQANSLSINEKSFTVINHKRDNIGFGLHSKAKGREKTLKNIFTNYASPFSFKLVTLLWSFLFVSAVWIFVHHVTEKKKRTYNILFTLLKRGMKITLWDWCLCLYMTFTALHFYLALCSFVFILSPLRLPNIILCHSQREKSHSAYKQGVLGQAGRQQLQRGWCFTKTLETQNNNNVSSMWYGIFHSEYLHLHYPIPGCYLAWVEASNWCDCLSDFKIRQ